MAKWKPKYSIGQIIPLRRSEDSIRVFGISYEDRLYFVHFIPPKRPKEGWSASLEALPEKTINLIMKGE